MFLTKHGEADLLLSLNHINILGQTLSEERSSDLVEGKNRAPNRRNGSSQKTVTTDTSKVVLDIPRDRNGTFDLLLIAKYQRRFPAFDKKIISM